MQGTLDYSRTLYMGNRTKIKTIKKENFEVLALFIIFF